MSIDQVRTELGTMIRGRLTWAPSLIVLIITICMCGCSSGSAIFRQTEIDAGGKSVVLDAEQRLVFNMAARKDENFSGRNDPVRIVCPEPSPDVAKAISSALSGTLKATVASYGGGEGQFASSAAETIVQLGERLATIQLLRDELADLCRSYANGAVSVTTYTIRLSKLDKKMVTLLVAASAASAATRTPSPSPATSSGKESVSKTSTGDPVKEAQGKVAADLSALKQNEEELQKETDKLKGLEGSLLTAQQVVVGAKTKVRDATMETTQCRQSEAPRRRTVGGD